MTQLERLKDELITLTVRRGYPAELGALMAAELGTEKTITRMITYLTHVAPERAEDMVDEMLAIQSDRDFWVDKKKSEYYQQQYNSSIIRCSGRRRTGSRIGSGSAHRSIQQAEKPLGTFLAPF